MNYQVIHLQSLKSFIYCQNNVLKYLNLFRIDIIRLIKPNYFSFSLTMRKIISREEKDKKTRRNQLILGAILILIMLFGYGAISLNSKDDTNEESRIGYNGIEFVKDNSGYWNFEVQGEQFITLNNPEEISNISFLSHLNLNYYSNKPLYFVGDIGEGSSEISRNLAERFVLRIQQACLNEEECLGNFPIKNCSSDNIIIFKEIADNETEKMYWEENCVFINSQYANQTKYADKFLFSLLGI